MFVSLITCFHGRAEKVERILRFYLDQDYDGPSELILFNNANEPQVLADFPIPDNKRITLINNNLDLITGQPYTNTGDIFRDALTFISDQSDLVNFFDSDDIFLPIHISAGVRGMKKASNQRQIAYKPYYSYFLYQDKVTKEHNNLEPSIFIDYEFIKQAGFDKTSASYHNAWLLKLRSRNLMLEDKDGPETLLYDWSSGHNTYKISGSGDDSMVNFLKHRSFETDFGDGILEPISKERANLLYKITYKCI